jgi:uncharacterized protein
MPSWPLALGVLTASLLGSAHCAGMCGSFVCFYATGNAGGRGGLAAHLAYNGGRLASYVMLGLLAGALGAGVDRVGALVGLSRAAAIVAGTLMVAWGVRTLLAQGGIRLPRLEGLPPGRNPLGALLARVRGRSPVLRAAATGLLTTLLPCGWLYAFVFAAAGTGDPFSAVAMMTIFWAGTLPMMLAVGFGAQRLTGAFRARLPMVTAAAVVLMGVLSIAGRLSIAPQHLAARARTAPAPAAGAAVQLPAATHDAPH